MYTSKLPSQLQKDFGLCVTRLNYAKLPTGSWHVKFEGIMSEKDYKLALAKYENPRMTSFDELSFNINELSKINVSRKASNMTQSEILESVRSNGFIVGSVSSSGDVSISSSPVIHSTATTARVECKRLANTQAGKAFVIFKLVGAELVPTNSISI